MPPFPRSLSRNTLALVLSALIATQIGCAIDQAPFNTQVSTNEAPKGSAATPPRVAQAASAAQAPAASSVWALFAAITPKDDENPPSGATLASEQAQFAHALSSLGLAQLRSLPEGENALVSPYGVAHSVGLVQIGTASKTSRELSALFQPTSSGSHLLSTRMGEINSALQRRTEGSALTQASRLWANQRFLPAIKPIYIANADKHYQTDAQVLRMDVPEEAATSINDWIQSKTRDRRQKLIDASQLRSSTRLIVTNAIHFKGAWATAFDAAKTQPRAFTLADATSVPASTMRASLRASWAMQGGAQLLELPYQGDAFVMQIALPAPGQTVQALQANLSGAHWWAWASKLRETQVDVSLPRIKIESATESLKPVLQKLGVETVFSPSADFSRLSSEGNLLLSDILQTRSFQIDEEGTPAVATGANAPTGKSDAPAQTIEFTRPFLFAIVHKATQTTLLMGRVMKPLP